MRILKHFLVAQVFAMGTCSFKCNLNTEKGLSRNHLHYYDLLDTACEKKKADCSGPTTSNPKREIDMMVQHSSWRHMVESTVFKTPKEFKREGEGLPRVVAHACNTSSD